MDQFQMSTENDQSQLVESSNSSQNDNDVPEILNDLGTDEPDGRVVGDSSRFFVPTIRSTPKNEDLGKLDMISCEYESLDYDRCVNSVWLEEERSRGYPYIIKKDVARWVVVFITGTLTALVGCFIDIMIEILSKYKYKWLQYYTDKCAKDNCLAIPYFLWSSLNLGPTLIAAFLGSFVETAAIGSGIPQVKCYLNGVKIPRIVRIKTLVAKTFGVIFSVLGGLAVGKEGPMIHSGAVIAAGVSQGKTTSFNRDFKFFEYFREDHEKRDFVSAGAAAGVAAAFGAPVGGVLFSLEEGASFWNQALTWRVFFGAMVSVFTLNLVLSAWNGAPGNLNYSGLLNFGKFDDMTYQIWEFIPFILMGIIGGLLGALFNFTNHMLSIFRMRYLKKPWRKMLEASVVALLSAGLGFWMIYLIRDCTTMPDDTEGLYPIQLFCKRGEVSAAGLLWFQTPEKTVRSLFHDPDGAYSWATIGVFFIIYYMLACLTYGLGIPSGLFIPTLLAGAAWGRLIGMLLRLCFGDEDWIDEGKYALVGAAAMLGGVVRMTISLTVILMECIGNITFGLPLMIVLMVAKWVGDYFNEGLYDIHIQMQGVPLMSWEAPPLSNNIHASKFMSSPVLTLRTTEKVCNIVSILKSHSYNGFPVVEPMPLEFEGLNQNHDLLRGVILRSQLTVLLKHKVFNENTEIWRNNGVNLEIFRNSYPRFYSIDDVHLNAEDLNCTVDLTPFMNPSPYSVLKSTSLPRVFKLFRALGLRHLVIINDQNRVVGIVTRKDLVKYRIWKHQGQMGLEQLKIVRSMTG